MYSLCCGMSKILIALLSLSLRKVPILRLYVRFLALCSCSFWKLPHLPPTHSSLNFLFPWKDLGGKECHSTKLPPNLCCKHVPTDSLKELIAPNNLTIWLRRSIPTRRLALQRLGPIHTTAVLLALQRKTHTEEERGGQACQQPEKTRQ